jgi:alginate O-acetyltransferase complex protein AlgI
LKFIAAYAVLVWLAPNTQELTGYQHANRLVGENLEAWPFRPLLLYGTALLLVAGLLGIQQHSEFIYFRF